MVSRSAKFLFGNNVITGVSPKITHKKVCVFHNFPFLKYRYGIYYLSLKSPSGYVQSILVKYTTPHFPNFLFPSDSCIIRERKVIIFCGRNPIVRQPTLQRSNIFFIIKTDQPPISGRGGGNRALSQPKLSPHFTRKLL